MPAERKKLRAGGRQIREYMEREWILKLADEEVKSKGEVELEEKLREVNKENKQHLELRMAKRRK